MKIKVWSAKGKCPLCHHGTGSKHHKECPNRYKTSWEVRNGYKIGERPSSQQYAEGVFDSETTKLRVIVSKDVGHWHLSISHPDRYPTLDEIRDVRYLFLPDNVTMAMIYPPMNEYVNVHPNCFHLWEIKADM